MSNTDSRIHNLKQMLSLEEQREKLQQQIEHVHGQIEHLRGSFGAAGKSAAVHRPAAPVSKPVSSSSQVSPQAAPAPHKARGRKAGKRAGRGALKETIFAELQAAGRSGVHVRDIAEKLNTKPVNIHAWFHAAVKRYPQVKKIEGGHYRMEGSAPAPREKAPATASKSSSAVRQAGASTTSGRSPRGQLSSNILSALQAAGKGGMSVSGLAEKLGAQYKNISIWFATTGKKNPRVKKVGRGVYRLN